MKNYVMKALVLLAGLMSVNCAVADEVSSVNFKCKVDQCSPQDGCQYSYNFGDVKFSPSTGQEFIFTLSDHWTVTDSEFVLDSLRFPGENYLSRTLVSMTIAKSSNALKMNIKFNGSGVVSHEVHASGSCEIIRATPLVF